MSSPADERDENETKKRFLRHDFNILCVYFSHKKSIKITVVEDSASIDNAKKATRDIFRRRRQPEENCSARNQEN